MNFVDRLNDMSAEEVRERFTDLLNQALYGDEEQQQTDTHMIGKEEPQQEPAQTA